MKKYLGILLLLVVFLLSACGGSGEDAQAAAYGDSEPAKTEVSSFVFTREDGSKLVQYVCRTSYATADPQAASGLNTQAFLSIFDPEACQLLEEFTVKGHSAAIYRDEMWDYACWTTTPEVSGAIRYDPEDLSAEDAHRIVESVFQ